MSYYLYIIRDRMEYLNDNGLKMYNHENIVEIKRDIVKIKTNSLCMVQFINDVKKEIGMSVPKTHKQFYYISDYADVFRLRYLKRFVINLKECLQEVSSEMLRDIINGLIENYSSNEWLLKYHFVDYEKEAFE